MSIKVELIKIDEILDITQLIGKVIWSGDYKSASRNIEFDIACSPYDKNIPKIDIPIMSKIKLSQNDKTLFVGYVWSRERGYNNNNISYRCYDKGVWMLENQGAYNFKGKTANGVVDTICSDFGIAKGNEIASYGAKFDKIFMGNNLYEIIMTYYNMTSIKSNKKYMMLFRDDKLNIIEKGTKVLEVMFENGFNISDSTFSEDIEGITTKVVVVDGEGKKKDTVTDNDLIKLYGSFQKVLKDEEGKDYKSEAKEMISGVNQKCKIEGYGDSSCITGYGVYVKDAYTGLTGLFYIDEDTHTFENGQHHIELTLNFKNIMDDVEVGDDEKEKDRLSSSSSESSSSHSKSTGKLSHPLPNNRRISSGFGMRKHPISGSSKMHNGIDLPAPSGTPIKAADGGTVSYATTQGSYGKLVKITHSNGMETRYAHCSSIIVKKGQKVSKGETIAKVGSTGGSTGNHLHFEVRVGGKAKNPTNYI